MNQALMTSAVGKIHLPERESDLGMLKSASVILMHLLRDGGEWKYTNDEYELIVSAFHAINKASGEIKKINTKIAQD